MQRNTSVCKMKLWAYFGRCY